MTRHRSLQSRTQLHILIRTELREKMDNFLFNEAEGRIPYGAVQQFIEMLIANFFEDSEEK